MHDPAITSDHYVLHKGWEKLSKENMDRCLQRKKLKSEPPVPTLDNIDFNGQKKYTHVKILREGELVEEEFLAVNQYVPELEGSIVIFVALKFIILFLKALQIFGDGTFKTTPRIYMRGQMWNLHFLHMEKLMTAVYCYLPKKSRMCYDKVLYTTLLLLAYYWCGCNIVRNVLSVMFADTNYILLCCIYTHADNGPFVNIRQRKIPILSEPPS